MGIHRWVGGLVATAAATGALVAGSGTAFADGNPPPTSAATAPAGQAVCTERIPKILSRIDRLTTRINGDANTRGSTAWLRDRQSTAKANGNNALADLIQVRIDNRSARLGELDTIKRRVEDVKAKDCAS